MRHTWQDLKAPTETLCAQPHEHQVYRGSTFGQPLYRSGFHIDNGGSLVYIYIYSGGEVKGTVDRVALQFHLKMVRTVFWDRQ